MENRNRNENLETEQQNPEILDNEQENNTSEAANASAENGSEETAPKGSETLENQSESNADEQKESAEDESADFKLKKELEKMKKELEEQKDKYIRLYAEFDNYRKRTQKEKIEAYIDAKIDTIKAFLPLLDNMEKAREYAKDDKNLEAIVKQFDDILRVLDVKVIESDGKQFDPNLHEALVHEEDDSSEENRITQTFLKGYMLGDKVIRHSLVKVLN